MSTHSGLVVLMKNIAVSVCDVSGVVNITICNNNCSIRIIESGIQNYISGFPNFHIIMFLQITAVYKTDIRISRSLKDSAG